MALVAITAAITGLLVPIVKAINDQRYFKEQRRYEAELARQSAVIEAQAKLLDDISTALWEYALALIAVSYYKTHDDSIRANKAFFDYEDKSVSRLGRIQALISVSRRLVSAERCAELTQIYQRFLELDLSLLNVQQSRAGKDQWRIQHNEAFMAQAPISEVLHEMAQEMRLASRPPKSDSGSRLTRLRRLFGRERPNA